MKRLQTPERKDSSSGLTDSAFSEDESSDSSGDSLQAEDSDTEGSEEEESGAEMRNEEESIEEEEMSMKEESSEEEGDDTAVNWKTNLAQKAADAFLDRQNSTANLWKLVYGKYIKV